MKNKIAKIISDHDPEKASELIAELVKEYQARAWDKGFGEGAKISHWWERSKGYSNKEHKNPYR